MNIEEKALKILEHPVCDNCLGRQFGQLLSGFTNKERGNILRTSLAMSADSGNNKMDMSNFYDFTLRNQKRIRKNQCPVCLGIFEKLDKYVERIAKTSNGIEFSTFLVGTRPSSELQNAEESLWERVGIEHCEPIKAEINREAGKLLEKRIKKKFSATPDVTFLINIDSGKIEMKIAPLFIYGEYQKLKRGIPQTRWDGKYKTSVGQITAKPFLAATKGKEHKFHAAGREDIDALCLAWRPFVLEILEPKKRGLNLNSLIKKIGKDVKVRRVRLSSIQEVRKIKELKLDKTYRATISCGKIEKKDLSKLKIKKVVQRTPQRVSHRRADLYRKRMVRKINAKFINSKKFELVITGESGLYIKELISGDNGRTQPSVSELLGVPCECKELDVIKIHTKSK